MSRTDRAARLAAAVIVAAAVCSSLASCGFVGASQKSDIKPGGFVLIGRAEVPAGTPADGAAAATGKSCVSPPSYTDIADLTRVTVTDSAGKAVASSTLGPGLYAAGSTGMVCEFPFLVRGVPDGSDTYNVAIGNRPSERFQGADLRVNTPAVIAFGAPPR